MARLGVLGSGSWGTALAIALSGRFESIGLWSHSPEQAQALSLMRENTSYLPGFELPDNVSISNDLALTLRLASIVLVVVPSRYLRGVIRAAQPLLSSGATVVSASKGLEEGTQARMSEVIGQELKASRHPVAVLSGPTFAREVAGGEPAAIVVASADSAAAARVQQAFATPALRLYSSCDVIGVEYGAALKNVIAIGAGICQGLGLGSNSVAALVTRGLAEISRLAVAKGGQQRTLSGLAGLGDLVLTATGDLSRNRGVGVQLGQGKPLAAILDRMSMVAEGVATCRVAYQVGHQQQIDLPIINRMYSVLYEDEDPRVAIRHLMDRPLTAE